MVEGVTTKQLAVNLPMFKTVNAGQHIFKVHTKALQRMLLLGRLFGDYEVGSYLLTSHNTDVRNIPPIDTAFVYCGQRLASTSITQIDDYDDINRGLLVRLGQKLVGRHHSHGALPVFQSGIDEDTNEVHLKSSSWRRVSGIPDPKDYFGANGLGNLLSGACDDDLSRLHLARVLRGLVCVTTNHAFDLYGEVHLWGQSPIEEKFDPGIHYHSHHLGISRRIYWCERNSIRR